MSKLPEGYIEYHRAFSRKGGKKSQEAQRAKYTEEELREIRSNAGKKGAEKRWKLSTDNVDNS